MGSGTTKDHPSKESQKSPADILNYKIDADGGVHTALEYRQRGANPPDRTDYDGLISATAASLAGASYISARILDRYAPKNDDLIGDFFLAFLALLLLGLVFGVMGILQEHATKRSLIGLMLTCAIPIAILVRCAFLYHW